MRADRSLDRHVEHLARNEFAHLGRDFTASMRTLRTVHDDRQGIDLLGVDQHVHLHHIGGTILLEIVIHRRVAARDRFQAIEKVQDDLGHWNFVGQLHLPAVVRHVDLTAALLGT